MKYFNFDRLVQKYSREFTVSLKSKGGYDAKGDWIDGEEQIVQMTGAVMALSETKVNNSNGVYTAKDKVLYMLEPIDNALLGAEIIFNGSYKIENAVEADDAEFTGVYHYVMKRVSAFDNKEGTQNG